MWRRMHSPKIGTVLVLCSPFAAMAQTTGPSLSGPWPWKSVCSARWARNRGPRPPAHSESSQPQTLLNNSHYRMWVRMHDTTATLPPAPSPSSSAAAIDNGASDYVVSIPCRLQSAPEELQCQSLPPITNGTENANVSACLACIQQMHCGWCSDGSSALPSNCMPGTTPTTLVAATGGFPVAGLLPCQRTGNNHCGYVVYRCTTGKFLPFWPQTCASGVLRLLPNECVPPAVPSPSPRPGPSHPDKDPVDWALILSSVGAALGVTLAVAIFCRICFLRRRNQV